MLEFKSRKDLFSYFQEYSASRSDEIGSHSTIKPLIKSYVIETFSPMNDRVRPKGNPFEESPDLCRLRQVDEALYSVWSSDGNRGYLERIDDRYWIMYSTEQSSKADSYVARLVKRSVFLDHLWISGMLFNSLWESLLRQHEPHRFIRMAFEYDDVFSIRSTRDQKQDGDQDRERDDAFSDEEVPEEEFQEEKRVSRIGFMERKSTIDGILHDLQRLLPSFYVTSLLRFPSLTGSGGHDVYYSGKVTNRGSDFFDHRHQIVSLCRIYGRLTETIERTVWLGLEKTTLGSGGTHYTLKGTPVSIVFKEPLSEGKFNSFVTSTFEDGAGPFRLWGDPIRLSPRLVHVYGLDLHLWQEVYLELTPAQFTVVLPRGTCGNTVHRLVANIQRYLEPNVAVFVGDIDYCQHIDQAVKGGSMVDAEAR